MNRQELTKAISEKVDVDNAPRIADVIMDEVDERLYPNLEEWIEGEPISDIWFGQYCVNAIMMIRNDEDFIDALLTMSLYLRDEDAGIRRIWRGKQ